MTITYEYEGALYVNLTNKCNCNCEFCLRHGKAEGSIYTEDSLWLEREPTRAEAMDSYREALANLVSFDLLVIDDFGLMQLDLNKCRNLFEVLESRDPGCSTMVVSQFPVSAWYDLFQEHTYADACLNRLLHNSYRLEMNGKNMRDLTPLNK